MSKRWAVTEIDLITYEHLHLHVILIPSYNEPGFYRQSISFDAFFMGRHRYNWNQTTKRLYSAKRYGITGDGWDEFNGEMDRMLDFNARHNISSTGLDDRDLLFTNYFDVWSFYKAIDWDYKKKRYLRLA